MTYENPKHQFFYENYASSKEFLILEAKDSEYIGKLNILFELITTIWSKLDAKEDSELYEYLISEVLELATNLRTKINNNPALTLNFFTFILVQAIWGFCIDLTTDIPDGKFSETLSEKIKDLPMQIISTLIALKATEA